MKTHSIYVLIFGLLAAGLLLISQAAKTNSIDDLGYDANLIQLIDTK